VPNYFKKDWIEDWKNERKLGRTKYVIAHGVLFVFIVAVVDALINDRAVWDMAWPKAIQTIALYLAGGLAYGLGTWWFNERKLKKQN
jgi:hypothetical protein